MNTANGIRQVLATRILGSSALLLTCAWFVQSAGAAAVSIDEGAWPRLGQLQIEIPPAGLHSLRNEPRTRVSASWNDGRTVFTNVVVRIKGRVGSFRSVDDKPSLTIDFDRVDPGQRWQGCRRVHLNNSVEDPSFQHELLAAEIFRSAGVAAPRVAYAVVVLNGRRLGLYSLREGITDEFLARHFSPVIGNLYEPEPGPGCDIDGPMKLNPGSGPSDRADLRALAEAVGEPDSTRRWERLGSVLDRERFLDYLALEILLGHRDGYALARNNYRLYHDPATDRFQFIPVGLDRLLGRVEVPLSPRCAGRVAEAMLGTDEGRAAFLARIGTLFTNQFLDVDWARRVATNVETVVSALTRSEARSLRREGEDLVDRIRRRIDYVRRQLAAPRLEPLRLTNGVALLPGRLWRPVDAPEGGRLERVTRDGRELLSIVAGPRTSASWRTRVHLVPGRYQVEMPVLARGLKPLGVGRNHGVAMTVGGGQLGATQWMTGDSTWTILRAPFEVKADGGGVGAVGVEVACNLRASAGEVWFDVGAARVELQK